MKKFSLSSLLNKKWFQLVFSIVAAFICWVVVVFTISPDSTVTIRNVPVNLSSSNSLLQSLGLDIIDQKDYTVNVTVEGPRSVVGTLDAKNVVVTPVFTSVTTAGTYDLKLVAAKANTMDNFSITTISPGTIKVRFDQATSKKFTVGTEIIGMSLNEGYMSGNVTATPSEITIIGTENEINSISKISAVYEVGGVLDKTLTVECPIKIYDENGNELPSDSFKLDTDVVSVTIPVYKKGSLPIQIEFTNIPSGFDVSSLSYVMSKTSIDVAASETTIDNLKPKTVGYVDLAAFKMGEVYTFDVKLPSGYVNLDNVETITVTFPRENITSKKVNVSDIRLQNVPSNYNITVVTNRINDVTVIGPTEEVEALLAGSVIAVVDVSQINIEKGSYNVPVFFNVTSNDSTWVVGNYTVLIDVEPS